MSGFISVRLIKDFATPLKGAEISHGKKRHRVEITKSPHPKLHRIALASRKIFETPHESYLDKWIKKLGFRRWVYLAVKITRSDGKETFGYVRVNRESLRKRFGIDKGDEGFKNASSIAWPFQEPVAEQKMTAPLPGQKIEESPHPRPPQKKDPASRTVRTPPSAEPQEEALLKGKTQGQQPVKKPKEEEGGMKGDWLEDKRRTEAEPVESFSELKSGTPIYLKLPIGNHKKGDGGALVATKKIGEKEMVTIDFGKEKVSVSAVWVSSKPLAK